MVLQERGASRCPWRCLGLPPFSPREVCRKRYLALALRLHPDKSSHPQAAEAFNTVEMVMHEIVASQPAAAAPVPGRGDEARG